MERDEVFQGTVREKCWQTKLRGTGYQAELGTGLIREGTDGLPATLLWAFVDDFMIHTPTRKKLIQDVNAFMNLSLRLGFICQKVKTKPPAQVHKYCGFINETVGIPTLHIPDDKCNQALAMIRYLKAGGETLKLSWLTLAVVTGLLQSRVETTPQRIGQMHLWQLYDRIHMIGSTDPKPTGTAFYYSQVELTEAEWLDLEWWEAMLHAPKKVQAYSTQQGSLGISFLVMGVAWEQAGRFIFWAEMGLVPPWKHGWVPGAPAFILFHLIGKNCGHWYTRWNASMSTTDAWIRQRCFTLRITW
jgi:hypothetical protein